MTAPTRILLHLLAAVLMPMPFVTGVGAQSAAPLLSHPETATAAEYEGAAALGLSLRRLATAKRVLMIAAHPDDESTQILAALALGHGAEVAYLSLTRGEGGQNGIGPELQEGLGLLRSEELLAARRLDGARQFFTRAYDYGYSKSAEEAFSRWPKEEVLSDVVATIRTFRPDVVLSIFSGTASDGHGQHQAAGILAREAFSAAADANRFPEQVSAGLAPHTPVKLYQALWRPDAEATETLATGTLDPLLGRSHYQIAMASRGRHRSQDMGRLEEPGPRQNALRLIEGRGRAGPRLFDGVDTLLSRRAAHHPAAVAPLRRYERTIAAARASFNPLEPARVVPHLRSAMVELGRAERALETDAVPFWAELREERLHLQRALATAIGIRLDAHAEAETVVAGGAIEVTLTLWNGGERPVEVKRLELAGTGWHFVPADSLPRVISAGAALSRRFRARAPGSLRPSEPYFLRAEREGDLYVWPETARDSWGLPFEPPLLHAVAEVDLAGLQLPLVDEVTYRGLDLRSGEFRRPLRAVPRVSLRLEPPLAARPQHSLEEEPVRFAVRMRADDPTGISGELQITPPAGWSLSTSGSRLRFSSAGEERTVEVTVTPPAEVEPGDYRLEAAFLADDGERFSRGYALVDYPHVLPRPLYRPAEAAVLVVDARLPRRLLVGYVAGPGDEVPLALEQLGVEVRLLGPQELATGNLDELDAIVTGIRAYEVRPDLLTHNQRLLEYAHRGGTLVVQYNKYEYNQPGIAPYPVEIARPHDRITDPAAPVTLLQPEHPALTWPNRITPRDFDGWVHERGLYHLHRWDARYQPLLEMADPGEEPQRGSLVVTRYGEGYYVYTGLAFFRQLPAGVPGAYRLFANLISLGARD